MEIDGMTQGLHTSHHPNNIEVEIENLEARFRGLSLGDDAMTGVENATSQEQEVQEESSLMDETPYESCHMITASIDHGDDADSETEDDSCIVAEVNIPTVPMFEMLEGIDVIFSTQNKSEWEIVTFLSKEEESFALGESEVEIIYQLTSKILQEMKANDDESSDEIQDGNTCHVGKQYGFSPLVMSQDDDSDQEPNPTREYCHVISRETEGSKGESSTIIPIQGELSGGDDEEISPTPRLQRRRTIRFPMIEQDGQADDQPVPMPHIARMSDSELLKHLGLPPNTVITVEEVVPESQNMPILQDGVSDSDLETFHKYQSTLGAPDMAGGSRNQSSTTPRAAEQNQEEPNDREFRSQTRAREDSGKAVMEVDSEEESISEPLVPLSSRMMEIGESSSRPLYQSMEPIREPETCENIMRRLEERMEVYAEVMTAVLQQNINILATLESLSTQMASNRVTLTNNPTITPSEPSDKQNKTMERGESSMSRKQDKSQEKSHKRRKSRRSRKNSDSETQIPTKTEKEHPTQPGKSSELENSPDRDIEVVHETLERSPARSNVQNYRPAPTTLPNSRSLRRRTNPRVVESNQGRTTTLPIILEGIPVTNSQTRPQEPPSHRETMQRRSLPATRRIPRPLRSERMQNRPQTSPTNIRRGCFEYRELKKLWRIATSIGGCMPVRPRPRMPRSQGFCLYHQVTGHWSSECPEYLRWLHAAINTASAGLVANSDTMPNPESNWEALLASSSDESVHVINVQSDSDSMPDSYDDPDDGKAYYYDSSEEEPVMIPPGEMIKGEVETDEPLFLENMFKTNDKKEALASQFKDECHVSLRSGTQIPERQPPKEKEKGARVEEIAIWGNKPKAAVPEYNILAHLRKVPALLSIFDALSMSQELREVMMQFLQNPKEYQTNSAVAKSEEVMYNDSAAIITFDDEDMLVGTYRHNKPLYITGTSNGVKLNRMLVDPGSSINILPAKSLRYLSPTRRLSTEEITIHGFDQHAQKSLGAVTLPFQFGDLKTQIKFYVIEADTSYRALLGRPWLHENHLVPSTLHQCIKYIENGKQRKIKGEAHPFAVREVGILDPEQTHEGAKTIRFRIKVKGITVENENPSQTSNQCPKNSKTDAGGISLTFRENKFSNANFEVGECSKSNELPPREVNQVQALDVMFVPAKVEYMGDKKIIHPPILFYKAEEIGSGNEKEETTHWEKWLNDEKEVMAPIELQGHYKPELMPLFRKLRCLEPINQERVEMFKTLWDKTPRKVTGVDGKTKNTRGLGYHKMRDKISIRREYENFWGIDSSIYCKVKIDQTTEPIHTCHTTEAKVIKDDEQFIITAKMAPKELEEGGQSTVDDLTEINLGTGDDPRPTFISSSLNPDVTEQLKALLIEYIDCFAWNYYEMPGLDPALSIHRLKIDPIAKPVKQPMRRMRIELEGSVIAEVKKLIDAGFIREEENPDWIANIVPVKKKNGQIRICVDYRRLNEACPKDDFPLPVTEIIIDHTSTFEIFSFMDGYSGYNQIKMVEEDQKHTAFRTPIGIYCYKVMPFGLKNAGATYQRAMTRIFDDLIHKMVECYVDDLVVQAHTHEEHLQHLRTVFERLRLHALKLNPLKCAFMVTSGKFLGFIIRHRGIEIDPDKIKAIRNLPPPRTLKELRSLQGRLAYIRRFIANLSGRIRPFTHLTKKDVPFRWDDESQKALDDIKNYLLKPPVLSAPVAGRPLILYTTALDGSLGALLAQNNDEGKETALYYLSRMLVGAEESYSPIEKQCLALIFATKKLRHYILAHKVTLISKVDPLKFLMSRPMLTGRLARWAVSLMEFDITYEPQKAIKGQALADFLAAHPIPDNSPLACEFPGDETLQVDEDEIYWEMYFDGASSVQPATSPRLPKIRAGIGLVFLTPEGGMLSHAFALTEPCTNNEAEYEALIAGLEIAQNMGIQYLRVYGDSLLILNQLQGKYQVRKPEMAKYNDKALELISQFSHVVLEKVPRAFNAKADALARLAKEMGDTDTKKVEVTILNRKSLVPFLLHSELEVENVTFVDITALEMQDGDKIQGAITIEKEDEGDWREPFIQYFQYGNLPREKSLRQQIKKRALRYVYVNNTLYRRSYDQLWLRCVARPEARSIMHEVHSGICGAHQSGPKMRLQIKRLGYYWPTMIADCEEHAKRCHVCQIHGNFIHQHPNPLHPTIASWPFDMWGTDIIGPIDPPSSKGHRYILAATDYFSKWAEAEAYREIKAKDVAKFFQTRILYQFGTPRRIVSDNGTAFKNTVIYSFARRHKIDWRYSSIYNPRANGLAEAFNKTLVRLLRRMTGDNHRAWHARLPEALWAYRTTQKTPTQATPYSLVFGAEAILPLEVELPSLRVAAQCEMTLNEQAQLRLDELDAMDERRLAAQQNLELHRARMTRAYDKLVRPRAFQKGELVLVLKRPITGRHHGPKFSPNWEGPYVINQVYEGGAYVLADKEGNHPMPPINGRYLKKYYA